MRDAHGPSCRLCGFEIKVTILYVIKQSKSHEQHIEPSLVLGYNDHCRSLQHIQIRVLLIQIKNRYDLRTKG